MVIPSPQFQSSLRLEDILMAQQGSNQEQGFMGGIMKNLPGAIRKFKEMQAGPPEIVDPQLGPSAGAQGLPGSGGMSMDPVQTGGGGMDLIQSQGFQPMRLEDVMIQ